MLSCVMCVFVIFVVSDERGHEIDLAEYEETEC